MELFVPGRLCLFGEHSDWAGGYRRENLSISKGYCLVAGTDQGLYATIKQDEDWFQLRSCIPDSDHIIGPVRYQMDKEVLNSVSESGLFERYAAGVAAEMIDRYPMKGIQINIDKMDLPLKKGLSSSAAVCVLVARAFNKQYNLNMTIEAEMDMAYLGEIRTGSSCGRMDQVCAYGQKPTFLIFDGDDISIEPLFPKKQLYFLVVDLSGRKDTRKILCDLNFAFQNTDGYIGKNVRDGLGKINAEILSEAKNAVIKADAADLGRLMIAAQENFDKRITPACPSELEAPKLHRILNNPKAKELAEGGKGVGSQGDGCAQFVFSDPEKRAELSLYLEEKLSVKCLDLTIPCK